MASKVGVLKWVVGLPAVAIILLMVIGFFASDAPDGNSRAEARAAIGLCWKEQAKKSLDQGTARFAASVCEKMETDYRARWGGNP
jgi:hypothetical protein